jgi:hypothetical protein
MSVSLINELGRLHKHTLQEYLTLFYGSFGRTDRNMRALRENTDSRNVKSRFHCILKATASKGFLVPPNSIYGSWSRKV